MTREITVSDVSAVNFKASTKLTGLLSIGLSMLHAETLRFTLSVLANVYEEKQKTVTAENTLRCVLQCPFLPKGSLYISAV
jgi:hypothetical protein